MWRRTAATAVKPHPPRKHRSGLSTLCGWPPNQYIPANFPGPGRAVIATTAILGQTGMGWQQWDIFMGSHILPRHEPAMRAMPMKTSPCLWHLPAQHDNRGSVRRHDHATLFLTRRCAAVPLALPPRNQSTMRASPVLGREWVSLARQRSTPTAAAWRGYAWIEAMRLQERARVRLSTSACSQSQLSSPPGKVDAPKRRQSQIEIAGREDIPHAFPIHKKNFHPPPPRVARNPWARQTPLAGFPGRSREGP